VLVGLGVVEQRYKAVMEALDGATVIDVARRDGVVRQTVHDWLRRDASHRLAGLVDRSSRPGSCPHQALHLTGSQVRFLPAPPRRPALMPLESCGTRRRSRAPVSI